MTKEVLIKFLNDSCTAEEIAEVIRWAREESSNQESKSWILEDWKSYQEEGSLAGNEKFSAVLDKIHHKINIDYNDRGINSKKRLGHSPVFLWFTRAAAILLLPVLSLFIYTISQNNFGSGKFAGLAVDSLEIVAPFGTRTVVEMTDGSQVHLNSGSRIKYPLSFSGDAREVVLSGEGYFNVAHHPDKPFIVKAGTMDITAIGTEFNVLAYPGEDYISTTLVEGKVMLERTVSVGEKETIGMMVPNQQVSLNTKTGEISSERVNIDKYIAWKDGKLVFENEDLSQVAARLNRMFNVDIVIDENVKEYTYTVTFVDEPLFQILHLMTMAAPVDYKALPRKKLPDGTYSKQKIIIEKR